MKGGKIDRILIILTVGVCFLAAAAFISRIFMYTRRPGGSKVSRTLSDLRIMSAALETFYLYHGAYPASTTDTKQTFGFRAIPPDTPSFEAFPVSGFPPDPESYEASNHQVPFSLTTPISYLTSFIPDIYNPTRDPKSSRSDSGQPPFAYYSNGEQFLVWSAGPDGRYDIPWRDVELDDTTGSKRLLVDYTYNPTNGIASRGDLWRMKSPEN